MTNYFRTISFQFSFNLISICWGGGGGGGWVVQKEDFNHSFCIFSVECIRVGLGCHGLRTPSGGVPVLGGEISLGPPVGRLQSVLQIASVSLCWSYKCWLIAASFGPSFFQLVASHIFYIAL